MKLKIDYREKEFISTLALLPDTSVESEVASMDLGDMGIYDVSGNELVLVERKTLSDLSASIKDGRYAEQSYRLTHAEIHNHNIIYLIEGDMKRESEKYFSRIQPSVLYSAMISLQYHKGFSVVRTIDVKESVEYITRLVLKLTREKNKLSYYSQASPSSTDYCELVKREKKANITSENIGPLMLSQIPGISASIARTILDGKSLSVWIADVRQDHGVLDALRETIHNKRRLSKTIINNLREFLFP